MTWAQRLKRVFKIDIETCTQCGGAVKVIASRVDVFVSDRLVRGFLLARVQGSIFSTVSKRFYFSPNFFPFE